jgi:hypothetical protein
MGRLRIKTMSKYQFEVTVNLDLVSRMFQEHGYTAEEICLRLRYPEPMVEELIKRYDLKHGEKSWRY